MKAHQLARLLLKGPNLRVVINGWGSCEGTEFEVSKINKPLAESFQGAGDTPTKPSRDRNGYQKKRLRISLDHDDPVYAKETTKLATNRIVKPFINKRCSSILGSCSLTNATIQQLNPSSFSSTKL